MAKYTFSEAAAKRVTVKLVTEHKPGTYLSLEKVRDALYAEDFHGYMTQRSAMESLFRFWMQNESHHYLAMGMFDAALRDVFDMRSGIRDLTDGLQRLGVIPYPAEDSE